MHPRFEGQTYTVAGLASIGVVLRMYQGVEADGAASKLSDEDRRSQHRDILPEHRGLDVDLRRIM